MENRSILLFGEITEQNILQAVSTIIEINEQDDYNEQMIKDYKRQPIKLFINSGGGSMHDGLALVDIMTNSTTPIITYCIGKCFSMGFVIFLCGHYRVIGKNASMMYHQVAFGIEDSLQAIEDTVSLTKTYEEKVVKIVLERTKLKRHQLEKHNKGRTEWFIHADECVKLGIADCVYGG